MNQFMPFIGSFIAGIVLGMIFFGGLWLTLNGLQHSHHPALRLLSSLLLRMTLALAGFYAIAQLGVWQHLPVALIGFMVQRWLINRRLRTMNNKLARTQLTHASKEI